MSDKKKVIAKAFVQNDEGDWVPSDKGKPLASAPIGDKAARAKAIEDAVAKKKASGALPAKPATPKPVVAAKTTKRAPVDRELTDEELETERVDDKPAKAKKGKVDDGLMSVSDVARALGVDPKRARARLRAAGKAANEGRWERVAKDSPGYAAIALIINPPAKVEVVDEDESDEEEEADA